MFRYDDSLSFYRAYVIESNNVITLAEWFVGELQNISQEFKSILDNPQPMIPLSIEKQDKHNNT